MRSQQRTEALPGMLSAAYDAAREFEHLAALAERSGRFSTEANARAVALLRSLERVSLDTAESLMAELRVREAQ